MLLSAIYFPSGCLPHVFGINHLGMVFNLGGKYLYRFSERDDMITLDDVSLNRKFINDFWTEGISMISTLVGRNGIGKTSILRAMNHPGDENQKGLLYIFEVDGEPNINYLNETGKTLNGFSEYSEINRTFEVQYYSSLLDQDLVQSLSSIALVKYHRGNLEEYYYDSIMRTLFLMNDPVIDKIKSVYPEFPSFDKYVVGVKQHRKQHFRSTYLEVNFGNPNRGDVLKTYLESELRRIEGQHNLTLNSDDLKDLLTSNIKMLESESFTELFTKIWDLPEYKVSTSKDEVHAKNNFIKDFEITILSYLLLGAVFPQTGQGGSFDFSKVVEASDFLERLDLFLSMYLVNEYKVLTDSITEKLGTIKIQDGKKISELILEDKALRFGGGIEAESIRQRMLNDIEMFTQVREFYLFIVKLIEDSILIFNDLGSLDFEIKSNSIDIYFELISKYQYLLEKLRHLPVNVSILEFGPNRKLSTGEKSLIEFYASLNQYIDNSRESPHLCYDYYLLLLDEPELGYHPLWKKKFIKALTTTLPVMFAKITPMYYDSDSKEYMKTNSSNPTLQIIFSTHDPLTLSDIPGDKVLYLDKDIADGSTYLSIAENKSFGANIAELLADSFFIKDGLIGDFAKSKIEKTISWIQENKLLSNRSENFADELRNHKDIIKIIDEPIIRIKLAEMISELEDSNEYQIQLIEKEIEYLELKKRNLQ